MKLEVRSVVMELEPGFILEGEDEEQIEEAVRQIFDDQLPGLGVCVASIAFDPVPDDRPFVRAEDAKFEDVDRLVMDELKAQRAARRRRTKTPMKETS